MALKVSLLLMPNNVWRLGASYGRNGNVFTDSSVLKSPKEGH